VYASSVIYGTGVLRQDQIDRACLDCTEITELAYTLPDVNGAGSSIYTIDVPQ